MKGLNYLALLFCFIFLSCGGEKKESVNRALETPVAMGDSTSASAVADLEDNNWDETPVSDDLDEDIGSMEEEQVWICTGPRSKAYHRSRKCEGLSNCTDEIMKMPIEDAEVLDRHACRYCCEGE